jgi:hypothetical protein
MKKKLALLLIMSSLFANITFADDAKQDCSVQLDVCLDKCTEKSPQNCEDICYEKQDLCIEKEDSKKSDNEVDSKK